MTGPTHIAIALAGVLAYRAYGGDAPAGWEWAALVVGSLAPDIDGGGALARPGSLLGRLLPHWLAHLIDSVTLTLSGFIKRTLGHRGVLHYPALGLLLAYLGHNWGWPLLFWLGIGCLAHLVGDVLTHDGIPLAGPILRRKISLLPFVYTGGPVEWLISVGLWAYISYSGLIYLWPDAGVWIGEKVSLIL